MLARHEAGQALMEYQLLLALVVVVAIVAVTLCGAGVSSLFSSVLAAV